MTYYSMKNHKLLGFRKSTRKGKMYDGLIMKYPSGKLIKVPFGSKDYENFSDKTGLNLYPNLIHGDKERQKRYKARHLRWIRKGYFSPSYFSMKYLWS